MWYRLRGRVYRGSSWEELSRQYAAARDASGEGASTFPSPAIRSDAGEVVGRLSYNGRVWGPKEWEPGDVPLYCPRPL